jgi:histidine triad (HIT) family protein
MACVFCQTLSNKRENILENGKAKAFLTNIPITPGHTLIIPKECKKHFEDLSKEEVDDIFDLLKKIKNILKLSMKAEGFNIAWNEGGVAGQSVPHFHLHVVPRTTGDQGITEYDPRKFLYRPGSRAESPEEELKSVTDFIRSFASY